jgi:hypothetical protein
MRHYRTSNPRLPEHKGGSATTGRKEFVDAGSFKDVTHQNSGGGKMKAKRKGFVFHCLIIPALVLLVATIAYLAPRGARLIKAAGIAYTTGDVFAGVGNGTINHYDPTGTLKDTLDNTEGTYDDTGMCFDAAGNLYATNFETDDVSQFDNMGNLLAAQWENGLTDHPENCVRDMSGHIYVGEADGSRIISKFNTTGGAALDTYAPATEDRGTDWFDLAADQCTMLYTSEGPDVKSFNVCTKTQNPDFATGVGSDCYALRILPDSGVLVACHSEVVHLDSSGTSVMTYAPGSGEYFFALNLDPDGVTFWTGGLFSGNIYRINISTGALVTSFNSSPNPYLNGLAVYGEPTVGGGGGGTGRMTGGGKLFDGNNNVNFGMELHCAVATPPNNLEVNWNHNRFHLESLTSASCTTDPSISSGHPSASFNTYAGSGTGSCNGVPGATATWTFADAGEPGRNDTANITINGCGGTETVSGALNAGNIQAHSN